MNDIFFFSATQLIVSAGKEKEEGKGVHIGRRIWKGQYNFYDILNDMIIQGGNAVLFVNL